MGCTSSKKMDVSPPVKAELVSQKPQKPKKQRVAIDKATKFQWQDSRGWNNYDSKTDAQLKKAYLIGHGSASFSVKNKQGEWEKYNFQFKNRKNMTQTNSSTGNQRRMRPPPGMFPPAKSMLPPCEMMFITLTKEQAGKSTIQVIDPRDPNHKPMTVAIPSKAKAGQKIAVPLPGEGETCEDVAKRQIKHNQGLSAGAKVAIGTGIVAAGGAAVVGGVILGDHLAGGTMTETIAETAVDVGEDIADFAVDAGEHIADFAVDAGEAIGDFAEDVGDWLGDAAEDTGDWICSIFE